MSTFIIGLLNITGTILMGAVFLWILCIIALGGYSRYINRNLEKLGELEVTLNKIKKTIGGFETFFDYKQIKEIDIKDHIKSIFFPKIRIQAKLIWFQLPEKTPGKSYL